MDEICSWEVDVVGLSSSLSELYVSWQLSQVLVSTSLLRCW